MTALFAQKHVFISYARSDGRTVAEELNQFLQSNHIATWQDVRDMDPHQDFSAEIEMAIEAALHVVVCLTPSIADRKESFVRREIIYAQGVGVPITPIVFSDFPIERIPVLINHYTWISVADQSSPRDRNHEEGFDQLLQRLRSGVTNRTDITGVDPFRGYLNALYKDIVSYLDRAVFNLVQLHIESPDDVTRASILSPRRLTLGIFQTALSVRPSSKGVGRPLGIYKTIPEAFRASENQLLVLGEAGAGKTTALMAFARDAIVARLEDPTLPLPLLGRLADWVRAGTPPIPKWLSSSLGLKENEIQNVLAHDGALLLFDGLDEIIQIDEAAPSTSPQRPDNKAPRDYRHDFMAEFERCVNGNQAMVTCRATDYLATRNKIALKGAAIIKPLDDVQIMEYLAMDKFLMAAVQSDPELGEIVRTPLLLSFFAFAYQGQKEHTLALSNLRSAPGEQRDHIIRSYVERRFDHEALRANWRPAISLSDTYAILGRAGLESQDYELTHRETVLHLGKPLEECIRRKIGDGASQFIEQMLRLHLLVRGEQQTLRFVHPLVADHFVLSFALDELRKDSTDGIDLLQLVTVLSRIGDCRAVAPLLQNCLVDGRIRPQFHFHLDAFSDPRILLAYARSLSSTDSYYIYEWVRTDAYFSLRKLSNSMGESNVASILAEAISGSSGRERADYVLALGLNGSPLGLDPLIGTLGDPDPEVRACSAFALGQLGDETAITALSALLDDNALENRPDHTYPWGDGGDTWDPRECHWETVVHFSVGQIAARSISAIRNRLSARNNGHADLNRLEPQSNELNRRGSLEESPACDPTNARSTGRRKKQRFRKRPR